MQSLFTRPGLPSHHQIPIINNQKATQNSGVLQTPYFTKSKVATVRG